MMLDMPCDEDVLGNEADDIAIMKREVALVTTTTFPLSLKQSIESIG